jgi:hypothetical protein
MNKDQFLADQDVAGFLDFFSSCLHNLEVNYASEYNRILPAHRHFHVTGVASAHTHYAWPGEDTFIGPPHPPIYNWATTSNFLHTARTALQAAIAAPNDPATWDAVSKILEWGLGVRATAALQGLRMRCPGHPGISISSYLGGIRRALTLGVINTAHITPALIPYASSGMSKVHSLASTDGLIIYDSRVAATVGECINEYLRRGRHTVIPHNLRVYREPRLQRTPMPLISGFNQPIFVRDYRWIECQVRVSWMFEAVLSRNPDIFPGLLMPERMHCLEAACFMMGAYLQPGPFAGRSFNFAHC